MRLSWISGSPVHPDNPKDQSGLEKLAVCIQTGHGWMDTWGGFWRKGVQGEVGGGAKKGNLSCSSKHGLLYGIIVSRSRTLFLLLRRLSGKVRLSGLRTTGSDGGREGRGGREGGRKAHSVSWLALAEEMARLQRGETDNERWTFTVWKDKSILWRSGVTAGMKPEAATEGLRGTKGTPIPTERDSFRTPITERRRVERRCSTNRVE